MIILLPYGGNSRPSPSVLVFIASTKYFSSLFKHRNYAKTDVMSFYHAKGNLLTKKPAVNTTHHQFCCCCGLIITSAFEVLIRWHQRQQSSSYTAKYKPLLLLLRLIRKAFQHQKVHKHQRSLHRSQFLKSRRQSRSGFHRGPGRNHNQHHHAIRLRILGLWRRVFQKLLSFATVKAEKCFQLLSSSFLNCHSFSSMFC